MRDAPELSPRHCEEPLRRSNPDCLRGRILDCFASLAMTRMWSRHEPHFARRQSS
ncbi:hypothetical protein GPL20_27745 [Bradyrhizobium cajani]|uniref:Uncharacterized protein n=1 Tax=Bradyrhizobium cajani TaxID=1928661 RepID=A0A844TPC6_9BRAD|nr:hypothetical protein [Bradyrhizobium cajani]